MDEKLTLGPGEFGPVRKFPEGGLEIRPLTVFIGKQGVGKSLVSQILYFFRNLPFLVQYYEARGGTSSEKIINDILDHLRSDKHPFSTFSSSDVFPTVNMEWDRYGLPSGLGIQLNKADLQAVMFGELPNYVERIRKGSPNFTNKKSAIFVPAERGLLFSARSPSTWQLLSMPSTMILFADAMEEAGNTYRRWENGKPDTNEGIWVRNQGKDILSGEIENIGDIWRWKVDKNIALDIGMASSGQKANGPLVLLSEVLFSWRKEGIIDDPFYLHIEEPEIHLHPAAQDTLTRILAYLVNNGFNVIVTTHSLTVLYTLNNLISASELLPKDLREDGVPEPEVRLSPDKVAAYLFKDDGEVESILMPVDLSIEENGKEKIEWLDEDRLREMDQNLEQQLNRIRSYGVLWGVKGK